jgi:prepilin-type N-terminal cleavage/methylation domain-containing protein
MLPLVLHPGVKNSYNGGVKQGRMESGFTLIELMIVVAIIGVLSAVAIPAFLSDVRKAKLTEVEFSINKVGKSLRMYYADHNDIPPSSTGYVPASGCTVGTGKFQAAPQSVWDADPGFSEMGFHLNEPGYFEYTWIRSTQFSGTLIARYNLDCNSTFGSVVAAFTVVDGGSVTRTVSVFPE